MQSEQREQSEQSEQREQSKQPEQPEQREQREQSEQSKQPEQSEQHEQSEQREQREQSELTGASITRDNVDNSAFVSCNSCSGVIASSPLFHAYPVLSHKFSTGTIASHAPQCHA